MVKSRLITHLATDAAGVAAVDQEAAYSATGGQNPFLRTKCDENRSRSETPAMNRRDFILASGALATAPRVLRVLVPARPKNILVLGGTHYLGPAIVHAALDRGHTVTLFNRGVTNPQLFPDVELIRGNRDPHAADLAGLRGSRSWDAVIDVWPSDPHVVAATARLLEHRIGRYVFVSSIVAYKNLAKVGITESDVLFDDVTDPAAWYEYDKAQCERALQQIFGDRHSVIRASIINGYQNDSDTFRFWLVRIQRGGEVLAPGDGTDPVQYTDVKDVGAFTVAVAERDLPGAYNVAGPGRQRITFREFLDRVNKTIGNRARLTWVSEDFLRSQNIQPFRVLAMWVPLRTAAKPGFMQIDCRKAVDAGLTFRPIESTVEDELRWFRETMPPNYEFGLGGSNKGFPSMRERELLAAWHATAKGRDP